MEYGQENARKNERKEKKVNRAPVQDYPESSPCIVEDCLFRRGWTRLDGRIGSWAGSKVMSGTLVFLCI